MALRTLSTLKVYRTGIRYFSKESNFVSLEINDKTGVATLNLQRPPVNSLNLELLSEISAALTDLEKNKSRGLILTSKNDGIFSAGLDILEMYKPEKERMRLFWSTLQDTWIKLYGCSFPSVALINGHSPAGGCLLSVCCEYRVMFKNYTIGLNETQLGIVAPAWFISSMKNVVGQRQTEKALTTGNLFKSEEALAIGLVDELVENKEEGKTQAEAFIKRFTRIPPMARALTKKYIRAETIENMIKGREADLNNFIQFSNLPEVQEGLGLYLESLKKKKSSKA